MAWEPLSSVRCRLSTETPSLPEANIQQAVNHTVSGVRRRSNKVPAVTEVREPQPAHLYRPSPIARAVEGAGRPLTHRLLADGRRVRDVPAKLAARVRVLETGQGRKTDPVDAHSIAAVALRMTGLRELAVQIGELVAIRVLADRRDGCPASGRPP